MTNTTTYAYNKRRLLTSETLRQPGWLDFVLSYGYDALGHLSSVSYPTGLAVDHAPNALGQPTRAGAYATGAQYWPNGQLKEFLLGNGLKREFSYNTRQLIQRMYDSYLPGTPGVKVYSDNNYTYDENGNVASITDRAPGGRVSRTMRYDGLDRLTGTNAPNLWGQATYAYDPLDNLRIGDLGSRQHVYHYNANNQLSRLATPGGLTAMTFSYDERGRMTQKNGRTHRWNALGQLTQIDNLERYQYDGHGRRTVQSHADGRTMFVTQYGLDGTLRHRRNEQGGVLINMIYLGRQRVAAQNTMNWGAGSDATHYVITDALYSTEQNINSSREVTNRMYYTPFGEQYIGTATGIGYTGHVADAQSGYVYMQQRYYDPVLGRFFVTDPIGTTAIEGYNFNRYWYANNNPYKYTDPDGRMAACAIPGPMQVCMAAATAIGKTAVAVTGLLITAVAIDKAVEQSSESAEGQSADDPAGAAEVKPGGAFPDRPLPRTEGGEPMPDPEAKGPHTQLGTKEGRNGSYPQAREFDDKGRPVRDIDFTDHGRPGQHSNPHEHPYRENPTGGTRQRGPEQPLRAEREKKV